MVAYTREQIKEAYRQMMDGPYTRPYFPPDILQAMADAGRPVDTEAYIDCFVNDPRYGRMPYTAWRDAPENDPARMVWELIQELLESSDEEVIDASPEE